MAVVQLGGHPVYITASEVGIDTRETAEDVARTFACYHRVICARVFDHALLERAKGYEEIEDRKHAAAAVKPSLSGVD